MDEPTTRVADFYRRHPYPGPVGVQLRADSFPGWLLAQVERESYPRRWGLLDLGCGTGPALAPIAALHPAAQVVGVDLSEASLAQIPSEGLPNLGLLRADLLDDRTVDLLLEQAPGGWDVVWCSGVLHHLSDPALGLRQIKRLLAPDGVVSLMVYGHYGRLPAARMARAITLLQPYDDERALGLVRDLLGSLDQGPLSRPPWNDRAPDVELADRYLHPLARSFKVAELLTLLAEEGLRPLRWLEPRAWSPRAALGPGRAAELAEALPPTQRWQWMEQLFDHNALELLLTHSGTADRAVAPLGPELVVDWNPQAALRVAERTLGLGRFVERAEVRLRAGPWEPLDAPGLALARAVAGPTRLGELLEAIPGGPSPELEQAAARMLDAEWLYRPPES